MLFKKHTPKDSVWTGFNKLTLCDPWTVAHQAPPFMGFSQQEYWSGLPFPSPVTKHRAQQRPSKNPPLLPLGGD